MQSKEAMCFVSHFRGYHAAKSKNVIDAQTFSCVVSTKLSFYHFLFVFTLLLFY